MADYFVNIKKHFNLLNKLIWNPKYTFHDPNAIALTSEEEREKGLEQISHFLFGAIDLVPLSVDCKKKGKGKETEKKFDPAKTRFVFGKNN